MARSAHAYVRGSTAKFYEWLESSRGGDLPGGPPVWIGGDCHIGNLGPVGSADGKVDIQIRDLDQTVIGNPAHDLIRLALSLATAARGSDLPGVTTAKMLEEIMAGYLQAFFPTPEDDDPQTGRGSSVVREALERAGGRTWRSLAKERIADPSPSIPLGKRFWPLARKERAELEALFAAEDIRAMVTALKGRPDDAPVGVKDAAFWIKGCSSLGRLRYAALLEVGKPEEGPAFCLVDVKEAVRAAAPATIGAAMPHTYGDRVVAGARALSPYLGERMRSGRLLGKSVVLRELLPQDLKLEIERLNIDEARRAAHYLGGVVGAAHARQMDAAVRNEWTGELGRRWPKGLDAPFWLWSSVVDLVASHEAGYLEHCRRYALALAP